MPVEVFSNVGVTYVAGTLPPTTTTLNVTPGTGLVLPTVAIGEHFTLVLTSPSTGNIEVVKCTARTGDTLTIERAQEPVWGRPAEAFQFEDGDEVRNAPSAAWYSRVAHRSQVDAEVVRIDAAIAQEVAGRTAADTVLADADTALDAKITQNADDIAALDSDLQVAIAGERTHTDQQVAVLTTAVGGAASGKLDEVPWKDRLFELMRKVNAHSNNWFFLNIARNAFPSGTRMLFQQSTPPVYWEKETAQFNDHALRVTTGNVTSRTKANSTVNEGDGLAHLRQHGFTEVFAAGREAERHKLTAGELPQHTHTAGTNLATTTVGDHNHLEGTYSFSGAGFGTPDWAPTARVDYADGTGRRTDGTQTDRLSRYYTEPDGAHMHNVIGRTGQQAGPADLIPQPVHKHDLEIEVNYTSVIIASMTAITTSSGGPSVAADPDGWFLL